MTLAVLRSMGWRLDVAMDMIQSKRPVVDWAEVYVKSVEDFMKNHKPTTESRRHGEAQRK
jgi:hypothetical protein